MAAFFLDSSALVKRYLTETGTVWVQGLCHPASGHTLSLARITAVEVASAVSRRGRGGTIGAAQTAAVLARFRRLRKCIRCERTTQFNWRRHWKSIPSGLPRVFRD